MVNSLDDALTAIPYQIVDEPIPYVLGDMFPHFEIHEDAEYLDPCYAD